MAFLMTPSVHPARRDRGGHVPRNLAHLPAAVQRAGSDRRSAVSGKPPHSNSLPPGERGQGRDYMQCSVRERAAGDPLTLTLSRQGREDKEGTTCNIPYVSSQRSAIGGQRSEPSSDVVRGPDSIEGARYNGTSVPCVTHYRVFSRVAEPAEAILEGPPADRFARND